MSGDLAGLPRAAIEALPAAICMTDAEGRITFYNDAAACFWGHHPELGAAKFCGSWKLYWPDGRPLPHNECPMAMALQHKQPIRGMEAVAERPNGTRISFIPYPAPLFDRAGKLIGAVNMLVDISEQKRAQQDKQRLAAIAIISQDAIISADLDGVVTNWNPGAERLFGYTAEEMVGNSIARLIPSPLRHPEHNIVDRLSGGGRIERFETTCLRKGGASVRVSLSVSPIRNEQGRVVGASSIARAVANRKIAEERLKEGEQVFRELLGALPVAVYMTDAAGCISYCNENAVNLWGIRPKIGKDRWCDLARFFYLDGRRMQLSDCPPEIALKQGRCVRGQEVTLERRDGVRTPIIPHVTPLRDASGAIIGLVDMTVDISARKQAEVALAERNAQLALAGRAALVGSYTYDVDKGVMQISEGYAAIHGLPVGATETSYSEWRARVHADDLARTEGLREQAFCERLKEDNAEYRIVLPSGEVRWIERRGSISYGDDGHPKRVIGVNIDITERKRAEQHQRTLNAELDHRVKNVLATVSAIIGQTQGTSRSAAEFAAGLNRRIKSLAGTHELLSRSNWHGVPLAQIVRRELAPYGTGNAQIGGPNIALKAEAAQVVAMVVHELTTNAAKYGALSNRTGRVSVQWRWLQNGPAHTLAIQWQEADGPPVRAPKQYGYGTSIIRELIPFELGGTAELSLAPAGTRCRLEIPGEWTRKSTTRKGGHSTLEIGGYTT